MKNRIKRIFVLTKRNLLEIIRDPLALVFILGLPLLMEVLFYSIFHKYTIQFEMKYLAPGIVVFSQTFLTLFIGQIISLDRNTSFLTRLYVSKATSFDFILSYVVSLIPIAILQTLLFYTVGIFIDKSLLSINICYSIILSIITSLLFLGLGVLFGSSCSEKSVGGVSSIVISCHSVLSGMWFPVDGLSGFMLDLMNILPFKNATILIQNSLNGNFGFNEFIKPLLIVSIYIIIVYLISIMLFKNKMKEK